ncbi:PAS domain-containing protein [Pontibacter rugosus]
MLGSIFHLLPGLYLVMTPDLVIQHATDAYLKATLAFRENLIGRYFFEVFPNNPSTPDLDSAHNFELSLQYVLEHKQEHTMAVLRYDIPRPQSSGGGFEERYWSPISRPILDDAGNLLYILHEARDITKEVLNEQEHLHNQERLYMLTDALHAVSWEYDIIRNKMTWGKGLQEFFGYTPEEMGSGGESWDMRVHPSDFDEVQKGIQQATRSGNRIWSGEYRFRKADGTYAPVLDQGYIIYDAMGNPIRTIGSIIDLSRSKRFEEDLQASDARFWHMLEVLPHMAWIADTTGRLIYFNENWYNYTGMKAGQVDGWINAVHPEDSAQLLSTWQETTKNGDFFEMEYRIKSKVTGEYRWFLDRGAPMLDEQGKTKLWIGSYTDIDDQKTALNQVILKDQYLEKVLNASPAHLCLLEGPQHICRYITPGFHKLYGNRQYIGRP